MNKKQPPHKANKAEETKRKLYESAASLFEQNDFDTVSVDSIVEAAGFAKGTFYIYFESKDALILSLLSEYVHTIDADYKAHLATLAKGMTASDMLLSLLEKIADVLTDTIGYNKLRTIYKIQLTEDINMNPVKGYDRELYKIFSDILGRGIKQGEFHIEIPLDVLTKHFVMAIRGLCYEWCIRYPDFDLKDHILAHFKLLLNGI